MGEILLSCAQKYEKNPAGGLDNFCGACYNKLLSEQTRRTVRATPNLDDAGRPHVIELNPQSNSGLYALDMDALLTAIRDNPEQFMPDPSRGGMPGCLGVREETCI